LLTLCAKGILCSNSSDDAYGFAAFCKQSGTIRVIEALAARYGIRYVKVSPISVKVSLIGIARTAGCCVLGE